VNLTRAHQSLALAIDTGKTDTRVALFDGCAPFAGSGPLVVPSDPGAAAPADRIESALDAIGSSSFGRVEAVAVGLAGFECLDADDLDGLADMLERALDAKSVTLASDAVVAHLAALDGQAGVVVAAGTGTVILGWDGAQRCAKVDGWGQLLDDAGSGFSIARQALASALREHDGRGGSAELRRRAERAFGPLDGLPARLEREASPIRTVASFAREVGAAARAGDDVAAAIFAGAARELAHGAVAAAAQVFEHGAPMAISWSGGVFAAADLLQPAFTKAIIARWPSAIVVEPQASGLEGARRLATGDYENAFGGLVWRRER
jgi:glucosamine kinase